MKIRQFIIHILPAIAIFILFAALRWINLDKRIVFGWDQEQFSNHIYSLVVLHKISLIGPRVFSDKGFFLGPYFDYLLLPFYLLTHLHPIALEYFIICFDIFFFVVALLLLKKLFGHTTALAFLFLWAINPFYDITPWNPLLVPLGVLLVWVVLRGLFDKNRFRDWIALGLTLGFFLNMHFQFVFMILFSVLFVILVSFKKRLDLKKILAGVISFCVLFTPILVFDLRHQFLNTKLLFTFFTKGLDSTPPDRNVWRTVFTIFLQPIILIRNEYLMLGFYVLMLGLLFYLFKNKKKFFKLFYLATLLLWLLVPVCFMAYGKRPSEYYFVFLFPFIYITIVDFFLTTKKYILLILLAAFLLFIIKDALLTNLRPDPLSLYYKNQIIQKLDMLTRGKKFNVSFSVPLGGHTGYDYLMEWYGIKQTGNWKDQLVQIHVPASDRDIKVGMIGIILPPHF